MKRIAVLVSLFIFGCTTPNNQNSNTNTGSGNTSGATVSFATVKTIIDSKCLSCHSLKNGNASDGISFDTNDSIVSRASQSNREIQNGKMPPRNATQLTDEEKNLINTWVSQGASLN